MYLVMWFKLKLITLLNQNLLADDKPNEIITNNMTYYGLTVYCDLDKMILGG